MGLRSFKIAVSKKLRPQERKSQNNFKKKNKVIKREEMGSLYRHHKG